MPPTLLHQGSLQGHPGEVPIDYITGALRREMPEFSKKIPTKLSDRVFIAKSETGSGKSTVLPAHVFRLLRSAGSSPHAKHVGRSVICTQPRVLTAVTLARDMSSSPNYPELFLLSSTDPASGIREGTIGYQTSPITDRPTRGLVYATAGVLLAQLRAAAASGSFSDVVSTYAFIIIDEAHERSQDIDCALMLIKKMLLHGLDIGGDYARRLPIVILASATIDVATYAKFFELLGANGQPLEENWYYVVGRQHPIEERWPAVGTNNYIVSAVGEAVKIHNEAVDPPDQRDILVFMPGTAETRKVVNLLELKRTAGELNPGGPVLILAINREAVNKETAPFQLIKAPMSTLWRVLKDQEIYDGPALEQMKAAGLYPRRIVVSTVVAETGLTIETLKYVIDPGWQRGSETYQPYGVQGLVTRPAAQSRIKQRKGRAGRLFPGVFVPLYTRKTYELLPEQQQPDVIIEGVMSSILDIILAQQVSKRLKAPPVLPVDKDALVELCSALEFKAEDIDMLDPPPPDVFASAVSMAMMLGFMSPIAPLLGRPPHKGVDGRLLPEQVAGRGMGLTALGQIAVRFPRITLPLRRLIMAAATWKVAVSDLVSAAAICMVCGERGLESMIHPRVRRQAKTPDAVAEVMIPAIEAGLPPYLSGKAKVVRMYIQDDILEGLLIFGGYVKAADEIFQTAGPELLNTLEFWCEKHSLKPETFDDIVAAREAIVEEVIVAGINPFWGEESRIANATAGDLPSRIQAFKRAVYDAFRCNELRPVVSKKTGKTQYENEFGLVVKCPTVETMAAAGRHVVAPVVTISPAPGTAASAAAPFRWMLQASMVSVLDAGEVGVAPDWKLVSPAVK